jgi:hypothetical protein
VRIALLPEGIHLMPPDTGPAEHDRHRRMQPAAEVAE